MAIRRIEVSTDAGHEDTIKALVEKYNVVDFWMGPLAEDGRRTFTLLARAPGRQQLIDRLQSLAESTDNARLVISDVEAVVPAFDEEEEEQFFGDEGVIVSREELHASIVHGTRCDFDYILLTALSTVVAAIGMLENNVAVLVGAMVIAPLLGPNLALAISTVLGDVPDIVRAVRTGIVGLAISTVLGAGLAMIWPHPMEAAELIARTEVRYSGIALALASGAAAVLSLTTGLSAALVGVMVAVALLPPAVAIGLMLGEGNWKLAEGAALLLIVNIVCLNLAAQSVLYLKGVKPRTGLEQASARRALLINLGFWLTALGLLVIAIYFYNR